jgi:hypothetical protein
MAFPPPSDVNLRAATANAALRAVPSREYAEDDDDVDDDDDDWDIIVPSS